MAVPWHCQRFGLSFLLVGVRVCGFGGPLSCRASQNHVANPKKLDMGVIVVVAWPRQRFGLSFFAGRRLRPMELFVPFPPPQAKSYVGNCKRAVCKSHNNGIFIVAAYSGRRFYW